MMKTLLIFLLTTNAFGATATIECTRPPQNGLDLTYRFEFSGPWDVTATIKIKTAHDESVLRPQSRSVPYSEGRMVGLQNDVTHDEELFLLPKAIFQSAGTFSVDGETRTGKTFLVSCRRI